MEIPDLVSDSYSAEIIIIMVIERVVTKILDYLKAREKRAEVRRAKRWKDTGGMRSSCTPAVAS